MPDMEPNAYNEISATSILNYRKERDSWFLDNFTINPYSGCSFNCLYCYIRGSKYGIHMERKLAVKKNALEVLEKELNRHAKKERYGFIVLSSATDPYLHIEQETSLTREILKLILRFKFPVHIITKSDLVLRDLDILEEIDKQAILPDDLEQKMNRKALITFSFSTIDSEIARIFEPGATPPWKRLQAMREVSNSGFLTGVSMMPLLPYISDKGEHLEAMFQAFQSHGAEYVMPASLTLHGHEPASSRILVFRAVKKYYPELLPKYKKHFGERGDLLPYYKEAFGRKALELGEKYGMANRIANV